MIKQYFIKLENYDFTDKKGKHVKCSKIRDSIFNLDLCTTNEDVFNLPKYATFTAVWEKVANKNEIKIIEVVDL